ncbi:sortase [Candidatus Nomurabacteria bacterium]|nr:sortase [Candidatus Nomurabacteria bacterium]MCB9803534.1 sortase [Candidatus Nomurabacteria bacterium]
MKKYQKNVIRAFLWFDLFLAGLALGVAMLFLSIPLIPSFWYGLDPNSTSRELTTLDSNISEDIVAYSTLTDIDTDDDISEPEPEPIPDPEPIDPRPEFNEDLPKQNRIIIPTLGIDSKIYGGTDSVKALNNGPWLIPDFARPDTFDGPVIIASHRWGGIGWTAEEKTKKSFLLLPELKKGDIIKIYWEQREYIYEVYKNSESTAINDYNADLILYTCKLFIPSDQRILSYAKLTNAPKEQLTDTL